MLNVPYGLNYANQNSASSVAKVQTGGYDTVKDMQMLEHVFGGPQKAYQQLREITAKPKSTRTTRHKTKSKKDKKNKTARK